MQTDRQSNQTVLIRIDIPMMQASPQKSTGIISPSFRALSVFAVLMTTFVLSFMCANRPLKTGPVSGVRDADEPRMAKGGSVTDDDAHARTDTNVPLSNVPDTVGLIPPEDAASANQVPEGVPESEDIPACGHMLVFTGPRHGSTWFVNNIENCSYSQPDGTFGDLFGHSELWVDRKKGFVSDLTVNEAVEWLQSNTSLKMFPVAWNKRQPFASQLVLNAHSERVPIVLLARDVRNAFRSMLVSTETGRWKENAVHSQNPQRHQDDLDEFDSVVDNLIQNNDPKWRYFKSKMTSHLNAARDFLNRKRIPYDLVTYDEFVDIESVVLPNANCVIRNCNFI